MEIQFAGMTNPVSWNHLSPEQISAEQAEVVAAQSDPRRFESLYTRYYARILSFVYQRLDSKEAAYDVTAQVFYRALDKLARYKNTGLPFSAWLFRIAINELNGVYRLARTQRTINIDDAGEQALREEIPELHRDVSDKELCSVLQILDTGELDLIDMRFFEKRSFRELSDITGLGESAVKMKVYRILEKLKKEFVRRGS
jgi:RNA polymerase sigma-70 factor (ECF subfamily)